MALPSLPRKTTLSPEQNINEAFESILQSNFDSMLAWAPIAYNREDIEGVHQVRVSIRRMRSAVSVFRKAIPREITDPWNAEMRWVASGFGPARDLDVFIDEGMSSMDGKLPLQGGADKLLELAVTHQGMAYAEIKTLMDSDRYKKFIDEIAVWIKTRGWFQEEMSAATREYLGTSIVGYAKKVLGKRFTKVLLSGAEMEKMTEEELHELRIECKKLRYATEFFHALFDARSMAAFTRQLKDVQGLLGTLNDVAVMPGLLDIILEGEVDQEAHQYAGALLGWRGQQASQIHKQLLKPWHTFANTASPWRKR